MRESSEVFTKTRSPPALLSFKGQAAKHTTVKRYSIYLLVSFLCSRLPKRKVSFEFGGALRDIQKDGCEGVVMV